MTNIQEVLDSLSFGNENEEVITPNTDSSTSIPSAREVELEKKIVRLSEKVEELSSFCRYLYRHLDSIEKSQKNYFDKLDNKFENLELTNEERFRRFTCEAEDNKFVDEYRKRKIRANERQKNEAPLREEIERQWLEQISKKNDS